MTWPIKRGDLDPPFTSDLSVGTAAINLAGASVRFIMRNASTGVVKVNAAATVVDASAGSVSYQWAGTDTDTVGLYEAEWEITSSGRRRTVPSDGFLYIRVTQDAGDAP